MQKRFGPAGPHPALAMVVARGLTFVDLAEVVRVSDDHLSLVLRGVRRPSDRLRKAIADALGVPVKVAFNGVDHEAVEA